MEEEEKNKILNDCLYLKSLLEKMQREILNPTEYRSLQYLLIKYEQLVRDIYPLCGMPMYDDKILFITDTHIGNAETMNNEILYAAYNEGIKQGIKNAIHLGDLIEATPVVRDKSQEEVENEIDLATSLMPNEIKTWLLLGNHDYSAIRTYPVVDKFFTNSKLEILGMGKCILFWKGYNVGLNHKISQLKSLENFHPNNTVELSGHVHTYSIEPDTNNIYLPPICKNSDDETRKHLKNFGYTFAEGRFSFVIGSQLDTNKLLFEIYGVDPETNILQDSSEKIEIDRQTKRMRLYKS